MAAKNLDRMASGLPKMLTTSQVAEKLGISSSTLCRWRAQGIGPRVYWLAVATPRYREEDILEWLERNAA
ncbi:MAG TPA: helix-turn-helix domain-containing protein [Nocardioidaceae bacterium]|nr:helix-turn-helix domain-containing protein [Nocardioidaceae bacterium]